MLTLSACPNSGVWCFCFQKIPFTYSFHFLTDLLLEFITSTSSLFPPCMHWFNFFMMSDNCFGLRQGMCSFCSERWLHSIFTKEPNEEKWDSCSTLHFFILSIIEERGFFKNMKRIPLRGRNITLSSSY